MSSLPVASVPSEMERAGVTDAPALSLDLQVTLACAPAWSLSPQTPIRYAVALAVTGSGRFANIMAIREMTARTPAA